jgi:nucleoside-diphosphate-sugar epimerase
LTKQKIVMMTSGEEWRQFTHITDLSRAFYAALNTNNRRRVVYDASSYEWVRIIDVANMIAKYTGAIVVPGAQKGRDPIPSKNMGRVPGWLPTIELEDGIGRMILEAQRRLRHDRKATTK